jgi:hypothetical protein
MSPIRCLALTVVAVFPAACGAVSTAPPSDAAIDSRHAPDSHTAVDSRVSDAPVEAHVAADASTHDTLTWYVTCGYPVCGGPLGADAGPEDAASCPAVGSSCSAKGASCGTPSKENCGSTLLCDDQNPAVDCPISSRTHKDGIQYADQAALSRLHDETLAIKLASYTYKPDAADPTISHLGFIVEDNPDSQAVNAGRGRVDMYGYVSMVVASLQVQEKEISALKAELETVRKEASACRRSTK